jgi:TRAP-type mannitol/chloroaromatic compound transport system permease small subunit
MLTPLCLIMLWLSGPTALDAFLSGEGSTNAGGLTVWPSKALIFFGFLLLLAQAISEILKKIDAFAAGSPEEAAQTHDEMQP